MIVGRVVRGENLHFFCVCVHVCCSAGVSEVLIKYTGKYVNIYFNMKITYLTVPWELFYLGDFMPESL